MATCGAPIPSSWCCFVFLLGGLQLPASGYLPPWQLDFRFLHSSFWERHTHHFEPSTSRPTGQDLPRRGGAATPWFRVPAPCFVCAVCGRESLTTLPPWPIKPPSSAICLQLLALASAGRFPLLPADLVVLTLGAVFRASVLSSFPSLVILYCLSVSQLGPVAAVETAKRATQAGRRLARASVPLPCGRPVLPITRDTRQKLKESWVAWLADERFTWEETGTWAVGNVGRLNDILSRYGRWLYEDGGPYYWFSETINMVSSEFPAVRRSLQQAWDLAQA